MKDSSLRIWVFAHILFLCVIGCAQSRNPVVLTAGPKTVHLDEFQEAFWERVERDSLIQADTTGLRRFAQEYADRKILELLAERDEPELEEVRVDRVKEFEERTVVEILRKESYGDAYKVSDRAVQRAYEQLGRKLHLRFILLEDQSQAAEIRRALVEGAVFAKVAEQRSLDPRSRSAGGDLGWLVYTDLDVEVRDHVFALKAGQLSPPIPWGERFQLFLVEEEAPNSSRGSLEEERPKLEAGLRTVAVRDASLKYQEDLLQKYHFEMDPAAIAWMTVLMRERTMDADRGQKYLEENPPVEGETVRPTTSEIPWSGLPVALADTGRVMASFDPPDGKVTPLLIFDQLMTHPEPAWPTFEHGEHVENLIRELVLERLEIREAFARGIDRRPEVIREVAEREMDARIRQFNINHIRTAVAPAEEEIRSYYDTRQAEFTQPEARRFLAVNFSDWDLAVEASQLLAAGKGLPEVEQKLASADPAFKSTGVTGTPLLEYGKSPLLDAHLFKLPPQGVSDPIPIGASFTVAQVLEIRPAVVQPYEEVKATIQSRLVSERVDAYRKKVVTAARQDFPVEIHWDVVMTASLHPRERS